MHLLKPLFTIKFPSLLRLAYFVPEPVQSRNLTLQFLLSLIQFVDAIRPELFAQEEARAQK